jgi:O-6-methylguanine DNA methyltransferase
VKTFAEKVYEVVKKIPKGNTMTYKEVAIKIGNPQAFRAVGTVLSKNFDKTIPCHRVIKTNGKMGGYNRGGENMKFQILKEEGKFK